MGVVNSVWQVFLWDACVRNHILNRTSVVYSVELWVVPQVGPGDRPLRICPLTVVWQSSNGKYKDQSWSLAQCETKATVGRGMFPKKRKEEKEKKKETPMAAGGWLVLHTFRTEMNESLTLSLSQSQSSLHLIGFGLMSMRCRRRRTKEGTCGMLGRLCDSVGSVKRAQRY